MAKLVFPTVGTPYRGFVGEVRGWLSRIASYAERSPGAVVALRTQIVTLATALGSVLFTIGAALSVRTSTGSSYAPTLTAALQADGTVRLASTVLPLRSGTAVAGPAVTGTYVSQYTFTIVAGAITAIVAS